MGICNICGTHHDIYDMYIFVEHTDTEKYKSHNLLYVCSDCVENASI